MSYLTEEIASQPECWTKAIEMAPSAQPALPRPGERVAAIGCGSSLNVARGYATLREAAGQGETDAFPASEAPLTRRYDRLVFISRTGTTTSEVARALATRPDLQDGTGAPAVTVVTNAMNIANELAVRQHIKIVVTGGVTRGQSYELIGPYATLVLAELTLDWAILGVDGLDVRAGATAHHEGEASINNLMATRAEQVMVVADSSKLGQRAFARVCGADDIDVIVTDRDASPASLAPFTERGIRVVTA